MNAEAPVWRAAQGLSQHHFRFAYRGARSVVYAGIAVKWAGKNSTPEYAYCGHHHLKPANARECAARLAKRLNRALQNV